MGISPIQSDRRAGSIAVPHGALFASASFLILTTLAVPVTGYASSAQTRTHPTSQRAAKLTPWEQAEQNCETLESIPAGARTRAEYDRALDGFRAIYHGSPGDLHAAASVYAVAELLAEQGREPADAKKLDTKTLQAAVGQYEFLRKQYPGSSLRVPALLAEAQLEANDLHDAKASRQCYRLLLKQYPHSEQAEEAKAGLAALNNPKPDLPVTAAQFVPQSAPHTTQQISQQTAQQISEPGTQQTGELVMQKTSGPAAQQLAEANPHHEAASERHNGRLAQVTGIRHWSTPTYTRVAIDLGDDVTFEAARVPNPDRIYFDLHGTRLAQELIGKSFAVTDDGFLKKIRAAQFSNDMTRVVLDVNDVSEYSAFLLPNPYRLIIDIHGGDRHNSTDNRTTEAHNGDPRSGAKPSAATASSLPPMPTTATTTTNVPAPRAATTAHVTAALPVPNTITSRSANTNEIASLSQAPGRVDATTRPTSSPISSIVTPAAPAANSRPSTINSPHSADSTHGFNSVGTVGSPNTAKVSESSQSAADERQTSASPISTDSGARHRGNGSRTIITRSSREVANSASASATAEAVPARAAAPTADGETSLVRALGLKIGRIVIDAGHGGHDSGTLGVDGIEEKDVVLDVALRLGKLLHDRLGAEIIYTRSDDTFIPLEDRTAIANKAQADLFLSIHANSSSDPTARGVETYYLNFTSSPDALETAARENAVSTQSIHQLSDLVKKITLKDKIDESREFASDVEQSLYTGLERGNNGLKNRGVKKAPFVVLIGANMPSILAEISFVTNPRDASELQQPAYRERVAESLYKGVARYESGLGEARPTLRDSATTADAPKASELKGSASQRTERTLAAATSMR